MGGPKTVTAVRRFVLGGSVLLLALFSDIVPLAVTGCAKLKPAADGSDSESGADFSDAVPAESAPTVPIFPHEAHWANPEEHGRYALRWSRRDCLLCHQEETPSPEGAPPCRSCHTLYPHRTEWKARQEHGATALKESLTNCRTGCHGADLGGGLSGVSCASCHVVYPHSEEWKKPEQHGKKVGTDGTSSCIACHGQDLAGDGIETKNCFRCHAGQSYPHPEGWRAPDRHGVVARGAGKLICQACHGQDFQGGGVDAKNCVGCHTGNVYPHPEGWVKPTGHGVVARGDGKVACQVCHGADFQGVGVPTKNCFTCHSGKVYPHPEGWRAPDQHGVWARGEGKLGCRVCHGEDFRGGGIESKDCVGCHTGKNYPHIAETWGTIDGHGKEAVREGRLPCRVCHGDDFRGGGIEAKDCKRCHKIFPHTANWKEPGGHGNYVMVSGKSGCESGCHGADLAGGQSGVSCSSCHKNYPHAPDWLGRHGRTVIEIGKESCTECHGSDFARVLNGKSCRGCHIDYPHDPLEVWREYSGGHGERVRVDLGKSTESCELCHGADLKNLKAGRNCFSCHPPYPHNKADVTEGPWHDTHGGYFLSHSRTECEGCHGADYRGGGRNNPSCFGCHDDYPHLDRDWAAEGAASLHARRFVGKMLGIGGLAKNLTACQRCHGETYDRVIQGISCLGCHPGGITHRTKTTLGPDGTPRRLPDGTVDEIRWSQGSEHGRTFAGSWDYLEPSRGGLGRGGQRFGAYSGTLFAPQGAAAPNCWKCHGEPIHLANNYTGGDGATERSFYESFASCYRCHLYPHTSLITNTKPCRDCHLDEPNPRFRPEEIPILTKPSPRDTDYETKLAEYYQQVQGLYTQIVADARIRQSALTSWDAERTLCARDPACTGNCLDSCAYDKFYQDNVWREHVYDRWRAAGTEWPRSAHVNFRNMNLYILPEGGGWGIDERREKLDPMKCGGGEGGACHFRRNLYERNRYPLQGSDSCGPQCHASSFVVATRDSIGQVVDFDCLAAYLKGERLDANCPPLESGLTFQETDLAVVSVFPLQGSTGVPLNNIVSAVFNHPLRDPSPDPPWITLRCGESIACSPILSDDARTLACLPSRLLPAATECTATATEAIRSLVNRALPSPVSFTFTTGVTVDTAPPQFDGVAECHADSESMVTCTWAAASDDSGGGVVYDLYITTQAGRQNFYTPTATTEPEATRYSLVNLSPATVYYLVVRARDVAGHRDTNTREVSVATRLAPPPFVRALPADGGMELHWTPADGAVGYKVYRTETSPVIADPQNLVATPLVDERAYEEVGLVNGTTYFYAVTAAGAEGRFDSSLSAEVSVTPTAAARMKLSAGGYRSFLVKGDGTVLTWGHNGNGRLGDGTVDQRRTPVPVVGEGGVGLIRGIVDVSAGSSHSLALDGGATAGPEDNVVWGWGYNSDGQVGDGTIDDRHAPVRVVGEGGVDRLTGVVTIEAGYCNSFAVKSDGTVWGWGCYGYGTLARPSRTPTPVLANQQGALFTGVVDIDCDRFHCLVLKGDGSVWGWGWANEYQLCDNTANTYFYPVPIPGPGGEAFLTDVVEVRTMEQSSLFLRGDGTVWGCGNNAGGQMSDGTTITPRRLLQQVLGPSGIGFLTGIVGISAQEMTVFALRSDGALWSWGHNNNGQIGDGSVERRMTPVQVKRDAATPFDRVLRFGAGGTHSLAVDLDGNVWGWGQNSMGQVGDGSTNERRYPVSVTLP